MNDRSKSASPVVGYGSWRRAVLLGAMYWLTLLPLAYHPRLSGNVWSRYLAIESLVERRTLVVEQSPMLPVSGTPDLVKFRGHFYSDKPPVLSAAGATVYAPLAWSNIRFTRSVSDFVLVNLVLVGSTAAAAAALTVACLRRLLGRLPFNTISADLLALVSGYGSLLLPYAITFNNHVVAAGLLTAAFTMAIEARGAARCGRRIAVAGGLAGLAAVIDLPAGGSVLLAFGVWLAVKDRGVPVAFVAGALPFLLAHCVLQSLVTGTPLPAESYPDSFLYPGSFWATDAGTFHESGPRWQFGLEMLFGPQGWLTVTPVLALGVAGLAVVGSDHRDALRGASLTISASVVAVLVFYVWFTRRTDFAGLSYGTRHLLAISPLVYFFALALLARWRHTAAVPIFAALVLVGAIYAWIGVRDPWSRIEQRNEPVLRVLQKFKLYPWSSFLLPYPVQSDK